jgi:outer membrane receptor protein involved in Fe transport
MKSASFPSPVLQAVLGATAFLLSAVPGRPQAAPARVVAADDTVQLSPFIISTERETGWSANETLSATRTKQALKDVPVNIDAITSDFMDDLGLFTADEVANFVANVYAAPPMEDKNLDGDFSFRGLSASNNVSRNYFRWFIPSDTYNVERIDFGKGSNSVIFGEVDPGGQGSVFTKRPLSRNFGTALLQYTSEGAYRLQLDVNRRLSSTLSLRFNAVRRQQKTFQDASTYKLGGETLAAVWQPFKNTSIRLEYEQGKFDNVRGFASVSAFELSARGRGFNSAGAYYTSDGVWIQQAALPAIDRGGANGAAGGSPSLLEGGFFDVQMRSATGAVVGTRRLYGFPKHYNLRGSFDLQARPFNAYTVTLEQRVGPVGLELAYNRQNQQSERNDGSFVDSAIAFDVNGRPYMDTALDRKRFGTDTDAFRGTAAYHWKSLKWMQQLFVASAEYREHARDNYRSQGNNVKAILNGTATAIVGADRGRLRVYLDDPTFYSRAFYDRMKVENLPVTSTVDMRMIANLGGNDPAANTDWSRAAAASFSASGRYFGGRLQSLLGLRRDQSRLWEYTTKRYFGPFGEAIPPPKRQDALPREYVENKAMNQDNTSYTAGLTWAVTKDVNVYGVYSESFRFQDAVTFENQRFGPITGVTKEFGVKGSLFQDRAGFMLGVFDIDRQNVALSYNNITSLSSMDAAAVEDLMNPNDILPGDPRYKYSAPGTASAARNYSATENSTGADLTLMLRPTKSLQLRFTIARAQVLNQPDFAAFRAYYDAAVKRGNESPVVLTTAKLLLDTLDISTKPAGARASPWSASWVVDYTFRRETSRALRGLRLGINGSWRDNYLFGVPNGQEMIGGTTHLVNAYVMRDQKIWGQQVRIRLGAKNLIDLENSRTRKTGFVTLASGANIYNYSYVMTPQYDLSLTVKF